MRKKYNYHQYTNYDKEPCGLKKLDYIVQIMQNYSKTSKKDNLEILDVGCGCGNICFPLAFLGYNVTGIDISEELIRMNSAKNNFSNLLFCTMDIEKESLNKNFDIVICADVIEHLHAANEFIENLFKNVKNEGLVIITIPNGYGFSEIGSRISKLFEKIGLKRLVDGFKNSLKGELMIQSTYKTPHVEKYTFCGIKERVQKAGFTLLDVRNSTVFSGTFRWVNNRKESYDSKLADKLPVFLVSGWYLTFKKVKK